MVLTYKELIELFGNDYQIKKKIEEKEIIKIKKGLYSPLDYTPLELISKKYPNAVFSFVSALYFHQLITSIPDTFYLTTKKNSTRIHDKNIFQFFEDPKRVFEHVDLINKNGIKLMVYNKEKTLVSLIKNRNRVPPSIYHEAVVNYRKISNTLNNKLIFSLINKERYSSKYMEILTKEIL